MDYNDADEQTKVELKEHGENVESKKATVNLKKINITSKKATVNLKKINITTLSTKVAVEEEEESKECLCPEESKECLCPVCWSELLGMRRAGGSVWMMAVVEMES